MIPERRIPSRQPKDRIDTGHQGCSCLDRVGHFEPSTVLLAWMPMTLGVSVPRTVATPVEDDALVGVPAEPKPPAKLASNASLGNEIWSLARYMAQTEVHTYAFSVAANTILSLFPFIVHDVHHCAPGLPFPRHGERDRGHDPLLSAHRSGICHQEHGDCGPCPQAGYSLHRW